MISQSKRIRDFGRPCKVPLEDVTKDMPFETLTSTGQRRRIVIHASLAEELVNASIDASERSTYRPLRFEAYNCRKIGGTSRWSTHAWAMAFDNFPTPADLFPKGGVWTPEAHFAKPSDYSDLTLHPEYAAWVSAFKERGWTFGGDFRRSSGRAPKGQTRGRTTAPGMDTPHIEWSRPLNQLGNVERRPALLKVGAQGPAVETVQTILQTLHKSDPGKFLDPGPIDGKYGPKTSDAVQRYQSILKITADGIWGPDTLTAHTQFMAMLLKPKREGQITEAYKDLLGRSPDAGGLAYYLQRWDDFGGIDGIRASLANSAEGQKYARENPKC